MPRIAELPPEEQTPVTPSGASTPVAVTAAPESGATVKLGGRKSVHVGTATIVAVIAAAAAAFGGRASAPPEAPAGLADDLRELRKDIRYIRVMAEDARGRQFRFTGPAGDRARQMAAAQAALAPRAPAPAITDDAHQFNVLAGGLDLPRTARGGVRDLAPSDAVAAEAPATVDASMPSAPVGRAPTLAETQETAAYTGEAPDADGWDTLYEDPAEAERRKNAKAAALGAHVKHAADVSFYEERPVTTL